MADICWRCPYFADLRGAIETDFATVCKSQTGSQVDRVRLLESIDLLRQELKGIGDQVRAHQFLVSLRFLDRFESEIQSR